jgi:uncharacterized protein with HEPN domain
MQSNNRDIASVWDMTQAIRRIQAFTNGLTFDGYLNDIRTVSAVERQFEVLGEAARSRRISRSNPHRCRTGRK